MIEKLKIRIYFLILIFSIFSCSTEDEAVVQQYQFVKEYTTKVTVGGVVGITERTFKAGEVYPGTEAGVFINIRIAPHSKLNEDCPNSWCYQEFLDVPRNYLKSMKNN